MKKKIITILIFIILGYILFKTCLLLYYKDLNNYATDYNKITIKDKNVTVDKSLANTKIDNLNIYIPNGFVKQEKYTYIPKNESKNNFTSTINISKRIRCYEQTKDDDKRLQTINYDKLMKKNNINSERDLIKYYYTKRKNKNIFVSGNDIKMNYLSEICVKYSPLDTRTKNYYLSGDLNGLLNVSNNYYIISVYNKASDEYYSIGIYKNSNKKDYVELISDLEFNKIIKSIYFS